MNVYDPAPLAVGMHCEKDDGLLHANEPGVHGPVSTGGVLVGVLPETVEEEVDVVRVTKVEGVGVVEVKEEFR